MTPAEIAIRNQIRALVPLKFMGGFGFDKKDLESAATFIAAKMVYGIKMERAGQVIKISAKVATRSMTPLDVRVTLLPLASSCQIQTSCTCIEGSMCKHVAGVLQASGDAWYEPREDLQELTSLVVQTAAETPIEKPIILSETLQKWLDQVATLESEEDESENFFPPANTQQRLIYVLRRIAPYAQLVRLHLETVKLTKTGDYAPHAEFSLDFKKPPEFLSPGDLDLLGHLQRMQTANGLIPAGPLWGMILARLATSGRLVWEQINQPALHMEDEEISVSTDWLALENGRQKPVLTGTGRNLAVIPTIPLRVIDLSSHTIHPVRSKHPERYLTGWLKMPELSPNDADHLAQHLESISTPAVHLPKPSRLRLVVPENQTPQPVLKLFCDTVFSSYYAGISTFSYDQSVRMAAVEFCYADAPGKRFPFNQGTEKSTILGDGKLIEIQRNLPQERELAGALTGCGLRQLGELLSFGLKPALKDTYALAPDAPTRWFQFLRNEVPKLEADGWQVERTESFNLELLTPDAWCEEIKDSGTGDWFKIDCGIEINGIRIQLLPAILAFLRSEGSRGVLAELEEMGSDPVMLPVGKKYLPFPADRFHRLLSVLTEMFGRSPNLLVDGMLEVHRLRAAQLAALATHGEVRMFQQTSQALQNLGAALIQSDKWESASTPTGLKAELRPYQFQGYRWLRFLATARLGGILADDMGLGKTLQTLAHLLAEKEAGAMDRPTLIVAPKSVVFNWAEEATKFTPKLRCMIYTGQDRAKYLANFSKHDLILTSYPILARDEEILAEQQFHLVVLDEAQNIKNSTTRTAQAAYKLQCRHRLCLTGTPMENHLGELWSIFHFLMPGFLGSRELFNASFREPIEEDGDADRRQWLSQRIAPVLLRRTKSEVLDDLPAKIETIHRVELSQPQKDLYEAVRVAMDKRVQEEISLKGAERSQIMILDALLKLRQVCCDPRLLKLDAAKNVTESAKLDALMEVLLSLIEDGRRVLLFSQFTQMLALIQSRLMEENIAHLILTGQTENRRELVTEFQKGDTPVFLISLKAGGVGLNLTAADTVIHYDPWWNPAAENQATDRAHRIGQKNTVFVYKFICQDTIEEKILLLQRKKAELVQGLLEGKGEKLNITTEDLAFLLEPLK